jgi:hypothetical protein
MEARPYNFATFVGATVPGRPWHRKSILGEGETNMSYPIDINKPWYHGSPLEFDILRAGSTITQWKELAEAFGTRPQNLSYDDGFVNISHNGTEKMILYIIDEQLEIDVDIYQHPRTTMHPGVEFLTKRPLKLKRI